MLIVRRIASVCRDQNVRGLQYVCRTELIEVLAIDPPARGHIGLGHVNLPFDQGAYQRFLVGFPAAFGIAAGLYGNAELCRASGVSARIDSTAVPVDPNVTLLNRARGGDALGLALHGGEDYQLLLAVPPDQLSALRELAAVWDLPITVLGQFEEGPGEVLLKSLDQVAPLVPSSHDHFRGPVKNEAGE